MRPAAISDVEMRIYVVLLAGVSDLATDSLT
jgi:hypothetical protein